MKGSNYNTVVGAIDSSRLDPWFIFAEITPEFYIFLLEQEPDKEKYEKYGLKALKMSSFPRNDEEHVGKLCEWEGGLLKKIQIPGDEANIELLTSPQFRYISHNLEHDYQAIIIASVLQPYLYDMELRMSTQ
jgi:hypothetical protein